jgi:hypothetical protein
VPARTGLLDQPLQDEATDAAPAPGLEHRHAADMAVGQQSPGAYRKTIFKCNGMERTLVELVELDLVRHALLLHEHREADRHGVHTRLQPRQELNSRHRSKV